MAINVKGIDKAALLVALFNAARPAALHRGYSHAPLDHEDALAMLEEEQSFSWVNGRALYVDLSGDTLDTAIYDSHNGRLCAGEALSPLLVAAQAKASAENDRDFASRVMAHSPIAAGPKG